MRQTLRFASCLMFLSVVLGISAVAAQETANQQPLLQVLARVPDTATSRSEIYFNDRRAIETAYPPAKMPANWAEFELITPDALDNPLTAELIKPLAVWWRVFMNNNSSQMGRNLMSYGDLPTVLGIDFFNINYELSYGIPPSQTLQLAGDFDLTAVRTAIGEQDFAQDGRSDVELWCGPDGCDSGAVVDVRSRNPANPFGGDLGRKWPLLVQDGVLIGSPDLTAIEDHIAVSTGTQSSLADAPEYQAAVEAVTAEGALLQAYFLDGEMLRSLGDPIDLLMANPRLTPEQVEQIRERLLEDYESLPAFELLLFADTVTDTDQAARVAAVYGDEATAQMAADIITQRIEKYQSLRVERPFIELLQERGVANVEAEVVGTASGKFVVVLTFATPKAAPEQILEFTPGNRDSLKVAPPGIVYALLIQSAVSRDLGWLSTVPREALAGS